MLQYFTNLHSLALFRRNSLSNAALSVALAALPKLTNLALSGCAMIEDQALVGLPLGLESFRAVSCDRLHGEFLTRLA